MSPKKSKNLLRAKTPFAQDNMKENLEGSDDDSFNDGLSANSLGSAQSPAKAESKQGRANEEKVPLKKINNKKKPVQRAKTMFNKELDFDVMSDPDYPPDAVNSNIIVEHIEANGRMQKVYKKTYYLIDGKTINITRMEQA